MEAKFETKFSESKQLYEYIDGLMIAIGTYTRAHVRNS